MRADETLADRTRFVLDADRWKAFMEALDAPPRAIPRLSRLLKEPSVFERGELMMADPLRTCSSTSRSCDPKCYLQALIQIREHLR